VNAQIGSAEIIDKYVYDASWNLLLIEVYSKTFWNSCIHSRIVSAIRIPARTIHFICRVACSLVIPPAPFKIAPRVDASCDITCRTIALNNPADRREEESGEIVFSSISSATNVRRSNAICHHIQVVSFTARRFIKSIQS